MSETEQWSRWLTEADSPLPLAPEDYDDATALARIRVLRERLLRDLPTYMMRFASPELYRDGTGLTEGRVTSSSAGPVLAWILLSHFAELATIADCQDASLLEQLRKVLSECGFRYVEYGCLN